MRLPYLPCFLALCTLLFICSLAAITTGAMSLPVSESLLSVVDSFCQSELSNLPSYQEAIVLELRLPRMLLAIFVGAILAQSGAVLQGLFRNPLADPGIIGVSSGAAVGAILAIVVFPEAWGAWTTPSFAFLFGLGTTLLVYALAQSSNGTSVVILLLAGVAISAFAGAAIGFMSYYADDQSLRALSLWQMGSLSAANTANLFLVFGIMLILLVAFQRRASALNALLLGESEARHLGIPVERLKLELIILSAIGVGVTVAFAGIIGFIGLVIPHLVRMSCGPDHRQLLPLSALLGAILLLASDILARLVVTPAELPVGLLTALLGAPFFLILLLKQRKNWA
jgi:iron complex transport system permease protein